jgi:tetratricopeptide (TPR) repeat protein
LKANYANAYSNLCDALREKGQIDEAIAAGERAVALNPTFSEAYSNLGNALKEKGRLDEAIAAFHHAIALKADFPDAHYNLGLALRDFGRFDEASASFREALRISQHARFYRGLASTGRRAADAVEIERLRALVNQPELPVDDRIDAEFVLGKLMDESDQFDEAFEHLAQGNRLFKQSRAEAGEQFDGDGLRTSVDGIIQNFTPAFFAERRAWGDLSEQPVFIVGMPRSGTTLIEQVAASHPSVFGASELQQIHQISAALSGTRDSAAASSPGRTSPLAWDAASIAKAARTYLEHLRSLGGSAARVTDKMPGNVFHLGLIAVLFPNARVIFSRRDARDNCLSCYFQRFAKNNLLYTYDLVDCGVQQVQTDRVIAHWLKALPLRMLEIQYETMVADQEGQSRRLVDFLGLPWDPACLAFHRAKRPVHTASVWQVRQPMYSRSVGRWRHYERHLGPLLEVLAQGG